MLIAAAQRLVGSSLRDGEQPELRHLELLRSASITDTRRLGTSEQKIVLAGMLMAQVRGDDCTGSLELAQFIRERRLNRMLAHDTVYAFLSLEAALTETYVAAGLTLESIAHADRLLQGISEGASSRWQLRAFGLFAAAHAIDGDHRVAQDYLDRIAALRAEEGWPHDRAEYMDAVAESVLGFNALDAPRLLRLRDAARSLPEREPTSQSLMHLIEAITLTTADITADVISEASGIARGSAQPSGPAFVRLCALAVAGIALIQRGTPAQAIAMLRDVPMPRHHSICFGAVRASAFIAMGDPRAALEATDACVRERELHNRWMLPGALLRRAIANLQLGHTAEAVADGAEALILGESLSSPRLGFFALPRKDVLALGKRISITRPRLARRLARHKDELMRVPEPTPPPYLLPRLSQRERIVALRLRSDRSYAQLAEELHVSPSTVKSQANMIARKLGGRTREDAVERLEKSGFYAIHFAEEH